MVRYITYKKNKLPLRISYYAIMRMQEELESSYNPTEGIEFSMNNLKVLEPLVYYGLESGHKAVGKAFDIKREEVIDILDECFTEIVNIIPEFFSGKNADSKKK